METETEKILAVSNFAKKLRTDWRKFNLPCENETLIVAVSGGADSCALLFALDELNRAKKLKLNLIVAHFNHNLRGADSDADETFVKELSKNLNLDFVSEGANIKSQIINFKENLEQWARNARYDFLFKVAKGVNAFGVLTAHTINDQAETFLLNLIRGSGSDGLGAMRVRRESQISNFKFQIVRPFLKSFRRSETENYCREKGLEFRQDSMNDDLNFTRVRIRKDVLPLLETFNPQIIEKLAETSFLLQSESDELNDIAQMNFQNLNSEIPITNDLELKFLKSLSEVIRKRVLRMWLKELRGDLRRIDAKHLQAIENLILSEKSGKTVELPNGEKIIKEKGFLLFSSPND